MVFYTRKDGKNIIADHRNQIELSEVRAAKKTMKKKRRVLDKKLCFDNDESLPDDIKTMSSNPIDGGIYKHFTKKQHEY